MYIKNKSSLTYWKYQVQFIIIQLSN